MPDSLRSFIGEQAEAAAAAAESRRTVDDIAEDLRADITEMERRCKGYRKVLVQVARSDHLLAEVAREVLRAHGDIPLDDEE